MDGSARTAGHRASARPAIEANPGSMGLIRGPAAYRVTFNSSAHPAGFAAAWSDKFAPWNHATRVVLWPHPFAAISHLDEGGQHPLLEVPQGNTTHMLMHLVSYVLGAAAEQRLPPGQPRVNTA